MQVHRFHNAVAVYAAVNDGTCYMPASTARAMAAALIEHADSVERERFSESTCKTWTGEAVGHISELPEG